MEMNACYAALMGAGKKLPAASGGLSEDTKWLLGGMIGLATIVIAMAGIVSVQISVQISGVNARIDDLNARIDDLRTDVKGLDARLRAVEVALGRLDPGFHPAPGTAERPSAPPAAAVPQTEAGQRRDSRASRPAPAAGTGAIGAEALAAGGRAARAGGREAPAGRRARSDRDCGAGSEGPLHRSRTRLLTGRTGFCSPQRLSPSGKFQPCATLRQGWRVARQPSGCTECARQLQGLLRTLIPLAADSTAADPFRPHGPSTQGIWYEPGLAVGALVVVPRVS